MTGTEPGASQFISSVDGISKQFQGFMYIPLYYDKMRGIENKIRYYHVFNETLTQAKFNGCAWKYSSSVVKWPVACSADHFTFSSVFSPK